MRTQALSKGGASIPRKRVRANAIDAATVREFGGGWNVVDNELNLDTRYSVVMDNMVREEDGSVGVRWGTRLFADLTGNLGATQIVNHYYYNDRIVVVGSDGRLHSVNAAGDVETIWNDTIAGALPDAPPGWSNTDFASFTIFNGKLIVCNGIDKPLVVQFDYTPWATDRFYAVNDIVIGPDDGAIYRCTSDHVSSTWTNDTTVNNYWALEASSPFNVQYLGDPGESNNNQFVPICRYVLTINKFVVMAGDPQNPDRLYISKEGAEGVWYGAPGADNNATFVDLGTYGVQGDQVITGLDRYRKRLVVGFWSAVILGDLGIFNDTGEHVPNFDDVIESIGCHSHHSMVNIGKDLLMLDHIGVPSVARSLYSGEEEPKRVSELIDPALNANVARLTDADTLLRSHAVFNTNDKQYMLFVPNYSPTDSISLGMNTLSIEPARLNAIRITLTAHGLLVGDEVRLSGVVPFNTLTDPMINDVSLTVTRVINADLFEVEPEGFTADTGLPLFGGGSAIEMVRLFTETIGYIYTFVDELKIRAWSRFRGWKWNSSTVTELGRVVFSTDNKLWVLGYDNDPIHSDYVDDADIAPISWVWELPWSDFRSRLALKHNRYLQLDTSGTATFTAMMFVDNLYKIEGDLYPYLLMDFVGGDNGGYGNNGQPYGGGRGTSDQRLYAWTARMKLGKLRFQGQTTEPLQIIAISLAYQQGSIRR